MKYDRSYDCNIECQFSCKNGNELWISYENGDILEEFRVFAFGERDNFLFDRLVIDEPTGIIVRRFWKIHPERHALEIHLDNSDILEPVYIAWGDSAYVSYEL